jgi:hypothetical protein
MGIIVKTITIQKILIEVFHKNNKKKLKIKSNR